MQTCNTSQQRDQSEIQHAIGELVVMLGVVVVVVVVVVAAAVAAGPRWWWWYNEAVSIVFNFKKIYPSIVENDLQLIVDIKLFIGLLQIEF